MQWLCLVVLPSGPMGFASTIVLIGSLGKVCQAQIANISPPSDQTGIWGVSLKGGSAKCCPDNLIAVVWLLYRNITQMYYLVLNVHFSKKR
jgi:hypothetical protein